MSNELLPVYVGYDGREDIAYKVCEFSLYKHSPDVDVIPLIQSELRSNGLYNREVDKLGSTEFTFTRFLVPTLQNYNGWALFCDCDFLWLGDIKEIFDQADDRYAVMVVKHDYEPSSETKMDGCTQTRYPRKNWSSMILWNCEHPANQQLDTNMINEATGQYLHRFQWLKDSEIGSLDVRYNWLVNWYKEPQDGNPFALHYTEGGPWFDDYRDCDYHGIWNQYLLEYADELGRNGPVTKSSITWVTSLSRDYYNHAAQHTLGSWTNLPGQVVFVWDDKSVDLGFGKSYNFYRDVVAMTDPWITEGMGGTKADRFWKKSRTQIWATRMFKGLVVWIDADITVTDKMTKLQALKLLHPKGNVWSSLDTGKDWPLEEDCPIDTGIVAFNTKHLEFEKFIRDYSLTWYNGDIYKLPQPYDHHAANFVREKWPMTSLCPHYSEWSKPPKEYISRFAMENSYIKDFFYHHLGIERKSALAKELKKIKK